MLIITNSLCSKIFVLIGPSGVRKSTIIGSLRKDGIQFNEIVSYTTRQMRTGEINGKDYFFIDRIQYKKKEKKGEFILSTKVHGNWYGISKNHINDMLEKDAQ